MCSIVNGNLYINISQRWNFDISCRTMFRRITSGECKDMVWIVSKQDVVPFLKDLEDGESLFLNGFPILCCSLKIISEKGNCLMFLLFFRIFRPFVGVFVTVSYKKTIRCIGMNTDIMISFSKCKFDWITYMLFYLVKLLLVCISTSNLSKINPLNCLLYLVSYLWECFFKRFVQKFWYTCIIPDCDSNPATIVYEFW